MPQAGRKSNKPHVVIVGGGFGGLSAVRALARSPLRVTLIDKRNYHLFRPLLYQVAAGLLSGDEVASPLRSVLSNQGNTDVLMAEVTGVDVKSCVVQMNGAELAYDYLILALGIRDNYFGHDDWEKFAPGLQALDDADVIRGKILTAFEEAERLAALGDAPPEEIQSLLTFVLVGGGTVGVEMASTIAELARMSLPRDFRHISADKARIILFEGQPCILPAYPKALSNKAQNHLQSLGVEVRTGTHVESVDARGVTAGGKRVESHTILWSAGVRPSPAGQWLGAET
ncbi:MAG: FAD-dependent oxidoreductase, partial [Terriglobales bacterium]